MESRVASHSDRRSEMRLKHRYLRPHHPKCATGRSRKVRAGLSATVAVLSAIVPFAPIATLFVRCVKRRHDIATADGTHALVR